MIITLEKGMSFRFQVHSTNPQAVREAVSELVHHFEDTLKYRVGTVVRDSGGFPVQINATKKTKVEVQKEKGNEYDTVNLVKYDEQQKTEGWNRLVGFAIRKMQEDGTFNEDAPKREEKLE